jgi:tetratricopeptide (TPR) repeat protein
MFRDHPLVGVGPFQFKALQLSYGEWDHAYAFLPLNHPHNLMFDVLSEGGILLLTASVWLLVRLARVWWDAWRVASPSTRRRLEASMVTLLAFGAHNMVDAFLQTQLMILILVVVAYVVSQDPYEYALDSRMRQAARWQLPLAAGILVAGQIAFVPIDRGALDQQRFLNAYSNEHYSQALEAVQSAEKADPWLDLYKLEEANTLGRLAYDQPDAYLSEATRSLESALATVPVWDVGWHNLASLYAQAGDYARAVDAETTAQRLSPLQGDYQLKLGEYLELAGDWDRAQETYRDLLADQPWRASSPFWATPTRSAFLASLITRSQGTSLGVDLQFYSGQYSHPDPVAAPPVVQAQISVLWPDGAPCLYCYYVRENPELLDAEQLLYHGSLTPAEWNQVETLARKAIFIGGIHSSWGWYILARLEEHAGHIPQMREDLRRAVAPPSNYRVTFPGIFRMNGALEVLPQARAPQLSPIAYESWVKLAQLDEQAGRSKEARSVVEAILEIDPYAEVTP